MREPKTEIKLTGHEVYDYSDGCYFSEIISYIENFIKNIRGKYGDIVFEISNKDIIFQINGNGNKLILSCDM
jgi:hypothetical protein